jgi:Xaa-Pro aminopeptidase
LNGDPTVMKMPYSRRLAALRAVLPGRDLDALIVTHPPNLRYLVGFDGSMGALVVTLVSCVLVVDGRYITSARASVAGDEELSGVSVELVDGGYEDAIARTVMNVGTIRNLGVEAAAITLSRFDRLSEALGRAEATGGFSVSAPRLRATERAVETGRLVKDPAELAVIREAAARLSAVARGIPALVRPGRQEREIAADLDASVRAAGFERSAFDTIVASGPNSALPHSRAGVRVLEPGDGVVLDFGGVYDGYCVDLTRTVQLEPITDEFARLFDAVKEAQAAAIAAVRPGIRASAIDGAARDVLTRLGLADAFVHGTGHGLGLEVHEDPRISRAGSAQPDEVLQAGMVFTIEPGAYVAGLGGVRIEDDVLVTEAGCAVLTDVPIVRTSRAAGEWQ